MKHRFITFSLMLLSLACQKQGDEDGTSGNSGQNPAPEPSVEYEYLLQGSLASVQTKVNIGAPDGDTYPLLWGNRDKVSLFASDGTLVQNLTLSEGAGEPSGTVSFKASSEVLSPVRVVYPYGKNGKGYLTPDQEIDGSTPGDIRSRSYFYSDPVSRVENETVRFVMKQPLAYLRVDVSVSGKEQVLLTRCVLRRSGAVMTGDYNVDHSDGSVSYGEAQADSVAVSYYNVCPSLSESAVPVWAVVLPCEEELQYDLVMTLVSEEEEQKVEMTVNTSMPAGKVTVIDVQGIDLDKAHIGDAGGFENNVMNPLN